MKNILTLEGWFDKFKKKKPNKETVPEETVPEKDESVSIDGNPFIANKPNGQSFWSVWHGSGFGGKPMGSIRELKDGNFILKINQQWFKPLERGIGFTRIRNIKIPSIERGLQYIQEEYEKKKQEDVDSWDIDLT